MAIVTLRHFVGNEQQLSELEVMVSRLEKAIKYPDHFKFKLKLGSPTYDKINNTIKEGIDHYFRKLREVGVSVEGHQGLGMGHALLKAVFDTFAERSEKKNVDHKNQNVFVVDGNQYDISNKRVLKAIKNMEKGRIDA